MPPITAASTSSTASRPVATPAVNTSVPAPPLSVDPDSFDGNTVKKAEGYLKRLGLHPGTVDRQYTANTERAVKTFQSAAGLDATGNLDVRTVNAMRTAAKRRDEGVQSPGLQSASVELQEKRLRRLGYDVGPADGLFDQKTAAAVRAFKKDEGKPVNGMLGKAGRELLETQHATLFHTPRRIRVGKSAARAANNRRVATAAAREHADGTKGFGLGSNGKSIKIVQGHLKAAGYDPRHQDGKFDDRTEGMVKEFQRKSDLPVTGRVDSRTWGQLKKATLESTGRADPKQMIGERSQAVKEVEKKLKVLGYNTGNVDGLYTQQTEKAVDAFRRRKGMGTYNGVGEGTLQAIRKAYKAKLQPNTNTVKGCAQFLLQSNNVSFWSGLSTGSDRVNLERMARTGKGFVNATGQWVTPKLSMMKALVAMAKAGPIQITALTGGVHSTNSNHYRGTAVDMSIHTGSPSEIARIANRFGGFRNSESDHIHLDF